MREFQAVLRCFAELPHIEDFVVIIHQAAEKGWGWGAAGQMALAIAPAQGWRYERHSNLHRVINRAARLSNSERQPFLHGRAEILHANVYGMGPDSDREDLTSVAELLELHTDV